MRSFFVFCCFLTAIAAFNGHWMMDMADFNILLFVFIFYIVRTTYVNSANMGSPVK